MKYIVFFTAVIFLLFSCRGTPKTKNEVPEMFQSAEMYDETYDFYEEKTEIDGESVSEEEIEEQAGIEEETEFEDEEVMEEETEIEDEEVSEEEDDIEEEPEEVEEVLEEGTEIEEETFEEESEIEDEEVPEDEIDIEDEEILEDEIDIDETEEEAELPEERTQISDEATEQEDELQTEPVEEAPAPFPPETQTETQQPAPPMQPPAQAPAVPQTQLPMQEPAQPQTQTQPQTQLPVPQTQTQPPAQVPAVPLPQPPAGPAEERIPMPQQEREFLRIEPITPVQPAETPENEEIVFSRVVRATVGQTIEIPFRGTGWVYLGELASRRGIVYNSRRIDPEGQSFIFRAEEAGTYALKFFRQDFIRDYIINDHVQVIVGEAPQTGSGWFNPPIDRGRVIAEPRWPTALEEAQIRGGSQSGAGVPETETGSASSQEALRSQQSAVIAPSAGVLESRETFTRELPTETPAPLSAELPAAELLQRARETFNSGNVPSAIALLDQYAQFYPSGTDELYWLYGQFYEANSPSRNILLSLDYYRRLMREYPQSSRYNDARSRVAYLERFYINIQ